MRIHHLNCGTMRPPLLGSEMVCHVLLVEAPDGLVLVDSGFGLRDVADPRRSFGRGPLRHLIRPVLAESETAVRQVARLGFQPDDVRHIVLTHFDADHVGGLADFPAAQVHLTATEESASRTPQTFHERQRYLPNQRAHGPLLRPHTPAAGDRWRGFASATELSEVAPGIVLLALPGHTRGHAAVAVDAGGHWVLHAGDAFFHRGQLDGSGAPRLLTGFESAMAHDLRAVRANHRRLAELWAAPDAADLLIVNAHDPELLRRAE